ncbi:MAG: TldD/PmbA family protein [Planctomycetota bacterium]|nr:TldD/PmbA family protein [Planctomycetota bacterium]
MKAFLDRACDLMRQAGATYGDIRIREDRKEEVNVKGGRPEHVATERFAGFGVRVIVDGAWGFFGTHRLQESEIEPVVRQAVAIAKASASLPHTPVALAPVEPAVGTYVTPHEIDPFSVPLEEKLALLAAATKAMRGANLKLAQAFASAYWTHQFFASTQGARIEQTIIQTGGGIAATAIAGDDLQVRSYPNSFRGNFATGGWEYVRAMHLVEEAPRVAEEAEALLAAPPCPEGRRTLILDGGQLALQVHESCGHPIELDRVLGMELSYAGDSFLTLDKLDAFQYGSREVNIVADATAPGGLGTFGWDDEGVPAQRTPIVEAGRFVGYLSSRETAPAIGRTSSGAMRASGWHRIPLIRMTNVNLLPGAGGRLEDLIADTDDGLYLATNKSWSIDNKRLNFQFGAEMCREIKGGRLGQIYKNATYTGITPEFWGACDAVCGPGEWRLWGTPNCGKGEPSQTARVGHGVAPARFRNVQVGVRA